MKNEHRVFHNLEFFTLNEYRKTHVDHKQCLAIFCEDALIHRGVLMIPKENNWRHLKVCTHICTITQTRSIFPRKQKNSDYDLQNLHACVLC